MGPLAGQPTLRATRAERRVVVLGIALIFALPASTSYAVISRGTAGQRGRGQSGVIGKPTVEDHHLRPGSISANHGERLTRSVLPRDRRIQLVFKGILERPLLSSTTEHPEGRRGADLEADRGFQHEVRWLAYREIINRHTLILADTGHDIPMAAELMGRGNPLHIRAVFAVPLVRPGSHTRIRNQVETFGPQIAEGQASARRTEQGAIFVGLDTHRLEDIKSLALPSALVLHRLGISKVVYLHETPLGSELSTRNAKSDIRDYVAQLEADGLSVVHRAVAPRPHDRPDSLTMPRPTITSDPAFEKTLRPHPEILPPQMLKPVDSRLPRLITPTNPVQP